jgi:hypothetical protein
MFRSTARNLRSWWGDFSEDILGADLSPAPDDAAPAPLDYHLTHPHRRSLGTARTRREGAVPERPTHCLCPVREVPASGTPAAAMPRELSR